MKTLLDLVNRQLKDFESDISSLYSLFPVDSERGNDKLLLEKLQVLLEKYPSNPVIIDLFANVLMLVDDEAIFSQYELKDVKDVIQTACTVFPLDVNLNLENYYFVRNIDDDEEGANEILDQYRSSIDEIFAQTED